MKSSKRSSTYRPFEDLKSLLEEKSFPLAPPRKTEPAAQGEAEAAQNGDEENRLFQELMADVVPMDHESDAVPERLPTRPRASLEDSDGEAVALLEELVKGGEGFIISDTPEYMEGTGYGVAPGTAQRLHQGDFSVQGHVDLHGLGVEDAHEVFESFLKEALMAGKRSVLVVHGRGLSSRGGPVLKTKVKEWLTSGPWRKWVVAFASARACDGGTGATYILLRQQPATKRHRKATRKK